MQILIEKMKLTLVDDSLTKAQEDAKIRENLATEKDLLEQLEEAKNTDADADPKAKGKKGGAKSAEEL